MARRQRAALRCNGLNLCPKRNLIIEKRVSGGTILDAFIGVMKMFHGCGGSQTLWNLYKIEGACRAQLAAYRM